jgi:phosphoribosylanthranilate isomerase
MKLKICGLNNPGNIKEIVQLNPDFIGFIFYADSKRYVANNIHFFDLQYLPDHVKRVGVFVNEDPELVELIYRQYKLDYVQLHGVEDQAYCARLFLKNIPVIKAFNVDAHFDFRKCDPFVPFSNYFLFDTKGERNGGNGKKFDWKILNNYDLKKPFFLSGGIGLDDADLINKLEFKRLMGVDVNSRFELQPGIKDVQKLKAFTKLLKQEKNKVI